MHLITITLASFKCKYTKWYLIWISWFAWVYSNLIKFSPPEKQITEEKSFSNSTQVLMLKSQLGWCQWIIADTEITDLGQTGLTAQMSTPPRMYGPLSSLFSSWTKPLLDAVWWVGSVTGKVKPWLKWQYLVQCSFLVTLLKSQGECQSSPPATTTEYQIHFKFTNVPRHIPKVWGLYSSACTSVSNVGEATNITAKYLKINYFLWHNHIKTC